MTTRRIMVGNALSQLPTLPDERAALFAASRYAAGPGVYKCPPGNAFPQLPTLPDERAALFAASRYAACQGVYKCPILPIERCCKPQNLPMGPHIAMTVRSAGSGWNHCDRTV